VVVEYLYDSAPAEKESGVTIKIRNGPTLTVHYDSLGSISTPGMPKLQVINDGDERARCRISRVRGTTSPPAVMRTVALRCTSSKRGVPRSRSLRTACRAITT